MFVFLFVTVVIIDDLIEEWSESIVRIVRSGVNTDSRFSPLGAGEDGLLESESVLIFLVLKLIPNLSCQALGEK